MVGVIPVEDSFGCLQDGTPVSRYTFTNTNKVTVRVINFGATVTDILLPDKDGKITDVSLGFDSAQDYESRHSYIGASLGRVTERITGAQFTIDGKEYHVTANDGPNQVHGGKFGFDMKMFNASIEGDKVVMKYVSVDGEEGYPGELPVEITFQLTHDNELILEYTATTTKPCPVNLSNHVYFNLGGHGSGNLGEHVIIVPSDTYIPVEKTFVPKGVMEPVENTPFDFRQPTRLGDRMKDIIVSCYIFGNHGDMKQVARLEHPSSGRSLICYTTEPCMETYYSAVMKNQTAKDGATYGAFENGGICLLPMQHSSGVNMPLFPNTILRPGEKYHQKTVFKFGF